MPVCLLEPIDGRKSIATPARYQSEDRVVLREAEAELLHKLERSLRVIARDLELAAMHGYDSDREVVLGRFHPVLDRDIVGPRGMRGCQLPPPSPELDPGQAPQRAGAPRLVPFNPFLVLMLEQRKGMVSLRSRREGMNDRLHRLLYAAVAAKGARKVWHERRQIVGRLRVATKPSQDDGNRACACAKHIVIQMFGELESGIRMGAVIPRPGACNPRETAMDDRLKRGARGSFAQRLLEKCRGAKGAFELCEKDESLGAPCADLQIAQ
jgi:hypothetical protein